MNAVATLMTSRQAWINLPTILTMNSATTLMTSHQAWINLPTMSAPDTAPGTVTVDLSSLDGQVCSLAC
jgi:hypothetical protein